MVKHRSCFKKKKGGTSVNRKKRKISAKKSRDRDKQYGSEKEDEESLLIEEMELERNCNAVDF